MSMNVLYINTIKNWNSFLLMSTYFDATWNSISKTATWDLNDYAMKHKYKYKFKIKINLKKEKRNWNYLNI